MSGSFSTPRGQLTAKDIARLRNGEETPPQLLSAEGAIGHRRSLRLTNEAYDEDKRMTRARVIVCVVALVVLAYISLGIMGAMGAGYGYSYAYAYYNPIEVARILYAHAYNALATFTHLWDPYTNEWLLENMPGYWAVEHRAGVVGITILCGILLSVSGMLYQNVFKNPLAGPGMLGASSGVSLGLMIMVVLYGTGALYMLKERYLFCYGFGVAVLVFVLLAGKKLSGKGKPFDIVTMLLIGSIIGQLAGFVQQYVMLFLYSGDLEFQNALSELQQMLTVDTSPLSWACLLIAFCVSFIPVYIMRFRMNMLAFDEEEARLLGVDTTRLRSIALICGAIMLLSAQIHTGMVGMVSLVVPFMSRSWFGCEFNKQLIGNVCIGTVLLLVCRDITDCIPFVGGGFGIGSVVQIVVMPLFVILMAKYLNSWE